MGNFWIAQFDSSSSSSSSTRPSSPAIVHNTSNEGTTGSAFSSCLGITKGTSNEGTHSGTRSACSSRLDEVSLYGQILPITPTLRIFRFAELKKATRKFSPDTVLERGGFGTVFKGWIDVCTNQGRKWDVYCCQEIEFRKFAGIGRVAVRVEYLGEPFSSKHCETFGTL